VSISDQLHAFERGWQGKDGIARQDGSGLGLTIVRGLVEQNEGKLTLVSGPGRGTEITIELPSATACEGQGSALLDQTVAARRRPRSIVDRPPFST